MTSLFSMGMQPLANKYPLSVVNLDTEIIEEMQVFFCDLCKYIHIPCSIDRSVFFEDYYYLSSVNKELTDHFNKLAGVIESKKYKFVLDVGSNDGVLLKPLKERGIRCLGVDPSENVSKIANLAGLETLVSFFDLSCVEHITEKYGRPDLICASSVFTHFEQPREFFRVADALLVDNGEVLIEVEYLREIVHSLGFERFYFDRPHYYSIRSLKELGDSVGFVLVRVEPISAHGGSVRAVFARGNAVGEIDTSVGQLIKEEDSFLHPAAIYRQFELFKRECIILREKLAAWKQIGLTVAGYGCPARFSTITNFVDIGVDLLPQVIDDSPLKSGRFSPGKHIPIVPFQGSLGTDIYIVFAYEYIRSIKEKIGLEGINYFRPIPFRVL
jgi:methylation protein EvaC